ncbi:UDP-N-acetylglucosamine transporter TMEM241 homolog [Anabrus simplex]|uniref:UDP-N-acetylglucosamine transporter TMEM241 homolog n=1 Tax=Anabrus simplex TaxID=316456 RepID=UPI0034DDA487
MHITKLRDYCHLCKNKMKFVVRSVYFDFIIYTFLFVSTIFVNKYVLSVLRFTYPTVFQAWQTLVGAVILKYLTMKKKLDVTLLDKAAAFQLLPHCIFFVGAIVAGSKALSKLPIPVFVSVCNLPPACIFLLDYSSSPLNIGLVQVTAGLLSIGAAISVIMLDITLPFADSGYSWLLAHVVFLTAQSLHARITDPHYTEFDKLYYSNIFSVVVLAPASFYLEEAFSALHFQHRRQLRFYLGCLCSGILGVLLQLWTARVRSGRWFVHSQALARVVASLLALPVFSSEPSSTVWIFIAVNLLTTVVIPSESELDEKYINVLSV